MVVQSTSQEGKCRELARAYRKNLVGGGGREIGRPGLGVERPLDFNLHPTLRCRLGRKNMSTVE